MHVIVVGAGIVGVCTAYWLNRHGLRVTVVDRRSGVAQEASFGNGGVFAADYASPSAMPGMSAKWLSYLFRAEAPVALRASLEPALGRWIGAWLAQSGESRFVANKRVMHRIGHYSRTQLHALRAEHGLEFEARAGYLQLLRSERDVALATPALRVLKENGVRAEILSPAGTAALEPCLNAALETGTPLAGAVHFPDDESGNCPLFARLMSNLCERGGVRFLFNTAAVPVQDRHGAVTGVRLTDGELLSAEAVVLACGSETTAMLAPLGVRLPAYPVRGYSANVLLRPDVIGPRRAFVDEAYRTSITPLGHRLRISGTAELGWRTEALRDKALRTLSKVGRDWLPGMLDNSNVRWWSGIRLTTPDGPPVLGPTRLPGLYLNAGHGSHGWTMAPGTGRVVADLVAGHPPEIDLQGLDIGRYARKN